MGRVKGCKVGSLLGTDVGKPVDGIKVGIFVAPTKDGGTVGIRVDIVGRLDG